MRIAALAVLAACQATIAAPASAQDGTSPAALIAAERERCVGADAYPGPPQLQQCDAEAVRQAAALTPASGNAGAFENWLADLFEPLLFTRTKGEDALAARVVVTNGFAQFALRRAEILTRNNPRAVAGDTIISNPLAPLRSYADPGDLFQRWVAIRDADCAAYPVSDCRARLDEALINMVHIALTRDQPGSDVADPAQ